MKLEIIMHGGACLKETPKLCTEREKEIQGGGGRMFHLVYGYIHVCA